MNKKFLSAILFGALMVTSTGTFVSCKDYDEDIDSINKELTDIKSQLAALQTKVDAGKWITGVTTTANGVAITMSDGQTLNITNGKDGQNGKDGAAGAQGAAGKDGSVVEVKDGVLCINGVATEIKVAKEAPAALPCVKVEDGKLMVLGADGKYAATGIEAGAVTAAKTNGVWTITVDGQEIVVPGSAALTSIAIEEDEVNFKYWYGIVSKDKEWGWNKEEKMSAGFYSRLDRDLVVLLNPAEADGTAFTYTFKNSKNEAADVTFFGEARPSTAVLTRAASANGLWTLPAAVTEKAATETETLRRNLQLSFKQNDGAAYAMSLEAADGLGNTAVRSAYDYKITLDKAPNTVSLEREYYNLIGQEYYPTIAGAVYDYKIRVKNTAENLRWAKVFGVEITEDGKGYSAANDFAVYHGITFEVAGILINGTTFTSSFTAYFTDKLTSTADAITTEALKAPLDATLIKDADGVYRNTFKFNTTYKYDLTEEVAALDADAQLLFAQAVEKKTINAQLIGGETQTGDNNYNEEAVNTSLLANNIAWGISYDAAKAKYTLAVDFYVDADYTENFQLNTAYQLNLAVNDAENQALTIVNIEFPFEFEQPTLDINQVDGDYSKWGTTPIVKVNEAGEYSVANERALLVYGVKGEGNQNMYLPLYDSFTAWKAADKANGIGKFQKYVDNAKYYNLHFYGYEPARILSETTQTVGTEYNYVLDNNLDYSSVYQNLNTWALFDNVKAAAQNTTVITSAKDKAPLKLPYELSTPIEVCYKHYGVYEAFDHIKYNDGKINGADFHLVFASWLNHSTLKMAAEEYTTARGTHHVYFTNDDLNFTTPKGDAFYLFDGLVNGKVESRAKLNEATFDEINEHPFTAATDLLAYSGAFKAVSAEDMTQEFTVEAIGTQDYWMHNADGEASIDLSKITPDASKIKVAYFGGFAKTVNGDKVTEAIAPGMYVILPNSITTGQSVILTATVTDTWGYKKSFEITIVKK